MPAAASLSKIKLLKVKNAHDVKMLKALPFLQASREIPHFLSPNLPSKMAPLKIVSENLRTSKARLLLQKEVNLQLSAKYNANFG